MQRDEHEEREESTPASASHRNSLVPTYSCHYSEVSNRRPLMATSDREVLWDRIVAFMEEEKILAPARLLGLAAALVMVV